MILILGLGNPGKKFNKTRHNLGFMVVDTFRKRNNFSAWKESKKFKAKISQGKINNKKVILAKPQTFMNNSGKSVSLLIRNWKLEIRNLIVIHDDLDLPLGKIKISQGKRSAGHKGVQSIINEMGTKYFIRFRAGIQQPEKISRGPTSGNSAKFVLEEFIKKEEKILKEVLKRTCFAIETAIKESVEKATSEYNK